MIHYAMSRGMLVVDENVSSLATLLRDRKFHTLVPPAGMPDDTIIDLHCAGRIIVTTNAKDFTELAPVYEFGIIEVTSTAMADPARVAQQISKEFSRRSLRHSSPFLLKITPHSTTFQLLD